MVATDVGGIPDIVRHEQTGLLVPQKDPHALAEALRRVLTDRAFAERLGTAGRDYAATNFSWPSIVDRVMALYGARTGNT